jgi:Amidohydrolase family/WD domain, G-beta repeat
MNRYHGLETREAKTRAQPPGGRRAAHPAMSPRLDKTARLWEAATGKQVAILRGHDDAVWSAAFSPDGNRVVTASSDKTARLWDAGAKGNSPVVPFNPFFAYYHFLTRGTISDGVYGVDERVTSREVLLRMITINYAALTGEADIKGTIEPGKLADFAVLSENLLTVEEAKIPTVRAMLTYVGGREVFRDAAMK